VEDSVYVRHDTVGRGVGSLLLAALVEHAAAGGFRQMVAAVGSSDNLASISLHERHGFVRAGVLDGVGVKLGRTLDVVLLQRQLGPVSPGR
jgi:Sortase and related acyltransferases